MAFVLQASCMSFYFLAINVLNECLARLDHGFYIFLRHVQRAQKCIKSAKRVPTTNVMPAHIKSIAQMIQRQRADAQVTWSSVRAAIILLVFDSGLYVFSGVCGELRTAEIQCILVVCYVEE
eukprot:716405_1